MRIDSEINKFDNEAIVPPQPPKPMILTQKTKIYKKDYYKKNN